MSSTAYILSTRRLRLRELQPERDAAFLLALLNDPDFVANVGDRGVRTTEAAADYIRQRIAPSYARFGFGMWLVELTETGNPLGICGLLKRENLADVDVGFTFLPQYRRQGYAFESASAAIEHGWQRDLPRIVAITAPHNTASIRLLEKLGLRYERTIQLTPDAAEVLLFSTAARQV